MTNHLLLFLFLFVSHLISIAQEELTNARFPGGEEGLVKFIQKEVNYPDVAKDSCYSSMVYSSFVVNTDGTVSDIHFKSPTKQVFKDETTRILKLTSGKWTPGYCNGREVKVCFTIPIFYHSKTTKSCKGRDYYYNRGNNFFDNNEFKKALIEYKKALSIDYFDKEANYNIGAIYLKQYNDDSACYYFNKILHFPPAKALVEKYCKIDSSQLDNSVNLSGMIANPEDEIFTIVEKMPLYQGASTQQETNKMLYEFFQTKAQKSLIDFEGTVYFSIFITHTGKAEFSQLLKEAPPEVAVEIESFVKDLPLFTPGYQRDKAVSVRYSLPIKFR